MDCRYCGFHSRKPLLMTKHLHEQHRRVDGLTKEMAKIKSFEKNQCYFCQQKFKRRENIIYHLENSCRKNMIGQLKNLITDANQDQLSECIYFLRAEFKRLYQDTDKESNQDELNRDTSNRDTSNRDTSNRDDQTQKRSVCSSTKKLLIKDFNNEKLNQLEHDKTFADIFIKTLGKDSENIKNRNAAFLKLFEYVHFNHDHPENHNLYVPNKKFEDFLFLTDDHWDRTVDRSILIKQYHHLFSSYLTIMEQMIEPDSSNLEELRFLRTEVTITPPPPELINDMLAMGYKFKSTIKKSKESHETYVKPSIN